MSFNSLGFPPNHKDELASLVAPLRRFASTPAPQPPTPTTTTVVEKPASHKSRKPPQKRKPTDPKKKNPEKNPAKPTKRRKTRKPSPDPGELTIENFV